MRQRNRLDTQAWLEEVQRDPRTLGALRARIERLLADPVVARAVAARLACGDALFVAGAADRLPVATHGAAHTCTPSPADAVLAPMRDYIIETDGGVSGPGPAPQARNPSLPGWFRTSAA